MFLFIKQEIRRLNNLSNKRSPNYSIECKLLIIYLSSIINCACLIARFAIHGAYSYLI